MGTSAYSRSARSTGDSVGLRWASEVGGVDCSCVGLSPVPVDLMPSPGTGRIQLGCSTPSQWSENCLGVRERSSPCQH